MTVGGELALSAHVSPGEAVHEWHGAGANWVEPHSSAKVKVLHANSKSKAKREDIQTLHEYTKNARLHNDDKFGELVAEIADVQWDIVMFSHSQTRNSHGIIVLHGGGGNFRHICFGSGTETFAAAVAILLHERHAKNVANAKVISDRAMYVDFTVGGRKLRSIAAYAPYAGYSDDDFFNKCM